MKMKCNYIEIHFPRALTKEEEDLATQAYRQLYRELSFVYPDAKPDGDLIDWRDEQTLWLWPNGFMEQWS